MNNNYDRGEEAPKTYDEMVEAGYEMTGDGFWIPKEEEGTVVVSGEDLQASVKLLLLLNGEQVLTQLIEHDYSDTYTLRDPREVRLQSTSSDGESVTSTIGYSDWFPLSKDREIKLTKSFVVSITSPLDSLLESYIAEIASRG